jgi:phosphoglycerate dehydrogenase-like enzyme
MSTNSSPSSSYWNRETGTPTDYSAVPITRTARILALSDATDTYNTPLYDEPLPEGATLLAVGATLADFDKEEIHKEKPNVLFVSHPMARGPLVEILERFPSVEWVHTRSAGIDFIASEGKREREKLCFLCDVRCKPLSNMFSGMHRASLTGLAKSTVTLTNAKGMFSSTLAEYCMMACSYFAKDLPRLMQQKRNLHWEQYPVLELRGATLGVVGYGDIGRASAKLAKAYGMKVIGVKRNPVSFRDEYCDVMYGTDKLNTLMEESDYVLISTPLTEQTRNMISKEMLSHCKPSTVIINVGRGPIIDEEALIEALQNRAIKGAGLDVMTVEPLPKSSPLWKLDNVLLSPHNMDMTLTFMRESTEFFVKENLPRWLRGMEVLNQVDKVAGY